MTEGRGWMIGGTLALGTVLSGVMGIVVAGTGGAPRPVAMPAPTQVRLDCARTNETVDDYGDCIASFRRAARARR